MSGKRPGAARFVDRSSVPWPGITRHEHVVRGGSTLDPSVLLTAESRYVFERIGPVVVVSGGDIGTAREVYAWQPTREGTVRLWLTTRGYELEIVETSRVVKWEADGALGGDAATKT